MQFTSGIACLLLFLPPASATTLKMRIMTLSVLPIGFSPGSGPVVAPSYSGLPVHNDATLLTWTPQEQPTVRAEINTQHSPWAASFALQVSQVQRFLMDGRVDKALVPLEALFAGTPAKTSTVADAVVVPAAAPQSVAIPTAASQWIEVQGIDTARLRSGSNFVHHLSRKHGAQYWPRPFFIRREFVTIGEFSRLMGWRPEVGALSDPMTDVSMYEWMRFLNLLSIQGGLTPAYRLTEIPLDEDRKHTMISFQFDPHANGYIFPSPFECEFGHFPPSSRLYTWTLWEAMRRSFYAFGMHSPSPDVADRAHVIDRLPGRGYPEIGILPMRIRRVN